MAAPALKDLPKVATDLKSQLEGFDQEKLKNASTQEKVVLPTAEGIYELFLSIWNFIMLDFLFTQFLIQISHNI